ncbi:MAG: hypothetical protein AUJ71_02390 [Candidatus Omnitrophica bacterium CG1_02_49_16]|nr:MAG: hypothetical protein AUJ71_02390 [Candidatus Omnitrophica bacterium CG1_02_49_16]
MDVKEILRKEEEKRRREAKRRNAEILALMEEQTTEEKFDRQGKLWGEESIAAMAEKANGGNGTKWSTDIEAQLCADIDFHRFGVEVNILASPLRRLILKDAENIVRQIIGGRWGVNGINLFGKWLDSDVLTLVKEEGVAPAATMAMIKAMVRACRCEAHVPADEFPFPEEEKALKELGTKLRKALAVKRRTEGKSRPADEASRVYLTEAQKAMPLDSLWEHLKKQGYQISRAGAWRAKKSGWFCQLGWQPGGWGEKIILSDEEKMMIPSDLAGRYGISRRTARTAKGRGYFFILDCNRDKIKTSLATPETNLPLVIYEIGGKKLGDFTPKEIAELLGYTLKVARTLRKKGVIKTLTLHAEKRADLASRLEKLNREG